MPKWVVVVFAYICLRIICLIVYHYHVLVSFTWIILCEEMYLCVHSELYYSTCILNYIIFYEKNQSLPCSYETCIHLCVNPEIALYILHIFKIVLCILHFVMHLIYRIYYCILLCIPNYIFACVPNRILRDSRITK